MHELITAKEKVQVAKRSEYAALSGVYELSTAHEKVQDAKPREHAALSGVHELGTAKQKYKQPSQLNMQPRSVCISYVQRTQKYK